jgi:holliday junction DNA helicase RuvA
MIAYLKGKFTYKSPALLHVDVNGVGYETQISLHTYDAVQALEEGLIYVHLHIREDAHLLFGFASMEEKELFLHLIGISGVGAATARLMLSAMKPSELTRAIINGQTRQLESIKGIGRKTAERIVLELRDKLAKTGLSVSGTDLATGIAKDVRQEAAEALAALGIQRQTAEQAVTKALESLPAASALETIIKKALQLV